MKKKLLLVITKSVWGGAGRYVFDVATAVSNTYDVSVALGGTGPLIARLNDQHIRTIPIPSIQRDISIFSDLQAFFELVKIIWREKPDIVHVNSSKAGGLGALAARVCGVRNVIFTAHGWAHNEPVAPLGKLFRWLASLLTLLLSHHVITVSHFDALHTPLGLKTIPIHNGIDEPRFLPRDEARAELSKIVSVPEGVLLIGTIAELISNLGHFNALNALEALTKEERAKIKYVIIGGGEQERLLRSHIESHGLSESVELAGFVKDASRLLKAFDIFLYTPNKSGLPYALLEAGAAELPVIATIIGGNPEVVEDQISGLLVPAYDTEATVKALRELIAGPNTRSRFAMRLKEKVSRYFGVRGMIKKTVEVYEKS